MELVLRCLAAAPGSCGAPDAAAWLSRTRGIVSSAACFISRGEDVSGEHGWLTPTRGRVT